MNKLLAGIWVFLGIHLEIFIFIGGIYLFWWFHRKSVDGKKKRLLEDGLKVNGLIVEKRLTGLYVSYHREPRMTIRYSYGGKDFLKECIVGDEVWAHYKSGDSLELIISKDNPSVFMLVISVKAW